MGFLKRLPSFNKRNRNKISEHSPAPTSLDPLKENVKLDLPLNVTPLDADANKNNQISTDSNTTPPTTELGLFDDIFSELNQTSLSQDSLQADISLTFALSQQLQLDSSSDQPPSTKDTTSTDLFGQDSIYSRYVNTPQQADNNTHPPSPSNAGVALSYTNTLGPKDDKNTTEQGTSATQLVLDSDISGSDDDDDDDDDDEKAGSEEEIWGSQQQLKGTSPIMERRPNDSKKDGNNRKITSMESSQTMLNRMKNRHRQQVKLQNSRPPPQSTPGSCMMRPTSPMHYVTHPVPASTTMAAVPPHFHRHSPMPSTPLTRSTSASSAYRHNGSSPWISDYTPSRPSPLAPNRTRHFRPSATTVSTMSLDDHDLTPTTLACSDEDADDESDHYDDNATLNRLRSPTTRKYMPTIQHSSSVPDFKNINNNNKRRQDGYSSQTVISDQQSTVSLSSSSSASTSTTNTTTTPSPTQQKRHHLFNSIQRQEGMHRMRTMTSEPDLKQFTTQQQQRQHQVMNAYQQQFYYNQQLQQQRQRMQLEWEMMQIYQREQQLKQEYIMLQQHSYSLQKSSTLPSLSAVQDPRFYYPLGPGLY